MKKRLLSIVLILALCLSLVPAVFAANNSMDNFKPVKPYDDNFTDISGWFKNDVIQAYQFGLVKGDSETTYNPNGDISIAETLTIAARIHSIYSNGSENFVQGDPWYQVYVNYCVNNGIIKEGEFTYTVKATRAQFAHILAASLPSHELPPKNNVVDNAIPDVKTTDPYAVQIYMLYRAGILTGNDSKGTFSPDKTISRGEVAAIINRLVNPGARKSVTLVDVGTPGPSDGGGSSGGSSGGYDSGSSGGYDSGSSGGYDSGSSGGYDDSGSSGGYDSGSSGGYDDSGSSGVFNPYTDIDLTGEGDYSSDGREGTGFGGGLN